jgi:hypothetical protein
MDGSLPTLSTDAPLVANGDRRVSDPGLKGGTADEVTLLNERAVWSCGMDESEERADTALDSPS